VPPFKAQLSSTEKPDTQLETAQFFSLEDGRVDPNKALADAILKVLEEHGPQNQGDLVAKVKEILLKATRDDIRDLAEAMASQGRLHLEIKANNAHIYSLPGDGQDAEPSTGTAEAA
jgi:hypothetical protein